MAVGLAPAVAAAILDGLGNSTVWTEPAEFWIQLHTADPGVAGTTAIAGNATRKQVSFGAAVGSTGLISNDVAVTWTTGEVDTSEDYTHWSAWSGVAGSFVCSGTMTANAVVAADQFTIPIGDLDLTLSVAA